MNLRSLASDFSILPPNVCIERPRGAWCAPFQEQAVLANLVASQSKAHPGAIATTGVYDDFSSAGYFEPRPVSASEVYWEQRTVVVSIV